MNIKIAAALAAGALTTTPQLLLAANAHQRVDACVKAFVASLGERYASETKLRETRYPADDLAPFGPSELVLIARNPRTGQKFVAQASCTVGADGQVIALQTQRFATL
jgi:hypothetical protein